MDANQTRYHLLLGPDDWGDCTDVDAGVSLSSAWSTNASPAPPQSAFYWDPIRSEITLRPLVQPFAAPKVDRLWTPADRRGAAADRFGNWYFIDSTQTQILVWSSGSRTTSVFWPPQRPASAPPRDGAFGPVAPPARQPTTFSGLAVTGHHYLVVGSTSPAGLLVFDLFAGGDPQTLLWPSQVDFAPFDMAPAPKGGLWILDSINRRYWALDADFRVLGQDQGQTPISTKTSAFQTAPATTTAPTAQTVGFPQGNFVDASSALSSADPIAIEALPDGTVLILSRSGGQSSTIEHYRGATLLEPPFPVDRMGDLLFGDGATTADPSEFVAQDLAFVPAATASGLAGRVLVALANGMQSFALGTSSDSDGSLRLSPLPDYYPMRLFDGGAIVTAGGTPYYGLGDRFVPLVTQRRPRYVFRGALTTRIFDGADPQCVWHRLILDACIPHDAGLQIASRSADDLATLLDSPFLDEPTLVRRDDGPELPFISPSTTLGTSELLFQRARGRYVQLRMTFTGNGRQSPRIRALRAYYPRFSYLKKYMPATYADNDPQGFLERFLANIEGIFTPIEDRIAAVQVLFDPSTAPSEALEWLAAWFGAALDPAWDDTRRRLFIRHVMDLFQWRGTVRGIQMAIDLVLSASPCDAIFVQDPSLPPSGTRIIEQFRTRLTPGIVLGDPTGTNFIPLVTPTAQKWTPDQGGAALVALWAAYVSAPGQAPPTTFPILEPPSTDPHFASWAPFVSAFLGFVPSTPVDSQAWTRFLVRRYSVLSALNKAYKTNGASFDDFAPFTSLPPDGAQLRDWYQFAGVVVPMAQDAHRFRVLIPLAPGVSSDSALEQQQLDLVTRLVDLESPAHTKFDVRFYWAMFRVGQVRLGYDTLLDVGSRAPQLMPRMVLGTQHLLEGHLAPGFPQDAKHRDVLGRDAIGPGSNS
jgi:phage tail-like protein